MASELQRLAWESDPPVGLDGLDSLSGKLSASVAQPRFAPWLRARLHGRSFRMANAEFCRYWINLGAGTEPCK